MRRRSDATRRIATVGDRTILWLSRATPARFYWESRIRTVHWTPHSMTPFFRVLPGDGRINA
ncbi:hypothetical protein WDY80_13975 [Gordonia hongkongensis]|uniref:hypothetical protein n=1 Tax=Gordonia hongkongensis TaxID=1701090 RepID=UPI001FF9D461|nr:hypothetical protein [Gordonia hongkongensis]UPG66761.1 hypothetical protein MVF96_14880 [Gordonia hongkongensis]